MGHPQLRIIPGDVLQPPTFENALKEHEVVVSSLGIQHRRPTTVYSQGIANIIEAMKTENVKRIICLSAAAVIVPP